ncbi:MAG: lysostaphin resistance A-like protein [Microgenomates group bacterium]
MSKKLWLPIFLGFLICLIYGLKKIIPGTGDLYFWALYLIPLILFLFKKTNLSEMGIRLGNPVNGLIFAFLLPTALFLRYKFMGKVWGLTTDWPILVIGSVGEEFFFRGYLQGQFEKYLGANLSILITNFFFMLVHVIKGYYLLPALIIFLIGIYFSYGRHPKGGNSLLGSLIAHPLYNLLITTNRFLIR